MRNLRILSGMIFFWSIFDGIMSYLAPLVITNAGFSESQMGLIIALSSAAGAVFDFLLSRIIHKDNYRRIYLIMFGLSFLFPLVLFKATTLGFFVLAMVIWGIYYDLLNFGQYDFVGRTMRMSEHASSFGIMDVFKALGYMIAPLLAGLLVSQVVGIEPYLLAGVFLIMGLICYFILLYFSKGGSSDKLQVHKGRSRPFILEARLWRKIGRRLLPVLCLMALINIFDSFFWTIGPIYAESLKQIHPFGGLFISAYLFPGLIVGWFVGRLVSKWGKKRTSLYAFFLGSLLLGGVSFVVNPILILLIVFVSSALSSVAWPAIKGVFVDYIQESSTVDREIEGLADFFVNSGYVIGPILAGILADRFGNGGSFTALGLIGAVLALILIKLTPKSIKVPTR